MSPILRFLSHLRRRQRSPPPPVTKIISNDSTDEAGEQRQGGPWTWPWTELPQDLIDQFLERLPLPDYIRFAAVATSWRDVIASHRLRCAPSPPRPLSQPWLVLRHGDETQRMLFYSPWEERPYRLPLRRAQKMNCLASSPNGWLLLSSSDATIFCLYSLSGTLIRLPKLDNSFHPRSAALSSSPADSACVVVILIGFFHLLLCRAGDNSAGGWTQLRHGRERPSIPRAVWFGERFYVATSFKELLVVVPSSLPGSPRLQLVEMAATSHLLQGAAAMKHNYMLVESAGVLLMITFFPYCRWDYMMGECDIKCKVYMADLSVMEWTEVEDIGDQVLFVSKALCISLPASQLGLGRGNVVYRAGDRDVLQSHRHHQDCERDTYNTGKSPWVEFDLSSGKNKDGALPYTMKNHLLSDLYWIMPPLLKCN